MLPPNRQHSVYYDVDTPFLFVCLSSSHLDERCISKVEVQENTGANILG